MATETVTVGVTLRLPGALRDALAASARRNRRSLNSEIVVLLEGIKLTPAESAST